jgi:type IX secretion system PorP/SprF family membrane protein
MRLDQSSRLYITIALCCALTSVRAQDPHFTQYSSAPFLINPALTGVFAGDVRVSGCYRSQWGSIQYPFMTAAVGVDAGVLQKVVGDDIAGVGFSAFSDKSNNGGLKTNQIAFSASYHKVLDAEGIYRLGVGFQGAYTTKNLDYNRFVFGQQLTQGGFDPTLPTGESKNGFSTNYLDFSGGVLFSAFTENRSLYLGAAMYHVNGPKESYNGPVSTVPTRFVLHAGGDFRVGEQNRLYWSGLFMRSPFTQVITLGSVFGISLSPVEDEFSLLVGGWYRYNDAVAPFVGLQAGSVRGGISYDVNVSNLRTATQLRGGFELSLNYIFLKDPDQDRIPKCATRF